jgi:hypothetical protein
MVDEIDFESKLSLKDTKKFHRFDDFPAAVPKPRSKSHKKVDRHGSGNFRKRGHSAKYEGIYDDMPTANSLLKVSAYGVLFLSVLFSNLVQSEAATITYDIVKTTWFSVSLYCGIVFSLLLVYVLHANALVRVRNDRLPRSIGSVKSMPKLTVDSVLTSPGYDFDMKGVKLVQPEYEIQGGVWTLDAYIWAFLYYLFFSTAGVAALSNFFDDAAALTLFKEWINKKVTGNKRLTDMVNFYRTIDDFFVSNLGISLLSFSTIFLLYALAIWLGTQRRHGRTGTKRYKLATLIVRTCYVYSVSKLIFDCTAIPRKMNWMWNKLLSSSRNYGFVTEVLSEAYGIIEADPDVVNVWATDPNPDPQFNFRDVQALTESLDGMPDITSPEVASILYTVLRLALAFFVVIGFGGALTLTDVYGNLEAKMPSLKLARFLGTFVVDLKRFIARVVEAVNKKDINYFFTASANTALFMARYDFYRKIEVADTVIGFTDHENKKCYLRETIARVEQLQADLEELKRVKEVSMQTYEPIRMNLVKMHGVFSDALVANGLHEAPYVTMIVGPSSIGKSTVADIVGNVLARCYGHDHDDPAFRYTINEQSEFFDGLTNWKRSFLWDDASTTKLVPGAGNPFLTNFMRIVNNQPFTPNMADLRSKGNVFACFQYGVITTNDHTLQTANTMVAPEAALRRVNLLIIPKLRPGYGTSKLVVPDDDPGKGLDCWTYDVAQVELEGAGRNPTVIGAVAYQNRSVSYKYLLRDATREQLVTEIARACKHHKKTQGRVMSSIERMSKANVNLETGEIELQNGFAEFSYTNLIIKFILYVSENPYAHAASAYLSTVALAFCLAYAVRRIFRVLSNCFWRTLLLIEDLVTDSWGRCMEDIRSTITTTGLQTAEVAAERFYAWPVLYLTNTSSSAVSTLKRKFFGVSKDQLIQLGLLCFMLACAGLFVFRSAGKELQAHDDSPKATYNFFHGKVRKIAMTDTSKSISNPAGVLDKIQDNLMCFSTAADGKLTTGNAIAVKPVLAGNIYVTNAHLLPGCDRENPDGILLTEKTRGILPLQRDKHHVITHWWRVPGKDVVYFYKPGRSLSAIAKYFVLDDFNANLDKDVMLLSTDGVSARNVGPVFNTVDEMNQEVFETRFNRDTTKGECGLPYIYKQGNQMAILGIHRYIFTTNRISGCVKISEQGISEACDILRAKMGITEADEIPMDDFETNDVSDRVLHGKSVLLQRGEHTPEPITGTLDIRGSLPTSKGLLRTAVKMHPYKDALLAATGLDEGKKQPPNFSDTKTGIFYTIKRHFLKAVANIKYNMPVNLVMECVNGYYEDAMARLYHDDMSEVYPLSLDEAINGTSMDERPHLSKYMGPIDMSTSTGHPHNKTKSSMFDVDVVEGVKKWRMGPKIQEQYDRVRQCIYSSKLPPEDDVMFDANMKDEPIKPEKNEAHKIRIILGSPVGFLILFRQLFLPIMAFMGANRLAFETCVFTVCQSYEWTLHKRYIDSDGDVELVDGDFKGWDSSLQKLLVYCFFWVARRIARSTGRYSDAELLAMQIMAIVILDSKINFFGDVIYMDCFMPSGQPATAQTNSVGVSVLFRMAWVKAGGDIKDFRHYVRLLTYGDDNWGSIRRDCPIQYDRITIATELASYGITLTAADKASELTPYSDKDSIDFLKRSWVWNEEANAFMAPLTLDTLGGMCTTIKHSKDVSTHDVVVAKINSLVFESFEHGREFYERIRVSCTKFLSDELGESIDFPTYDERLEEFHGKSLWFRAKEPEILACLSK